ncbi:uncharacterized protein LOC120770405 isoform X1 [Bactrocera tryoni]|uniref:uncharacterized protein LOC120770405 isoform X1 n=1 Tax=Bactrocera tryoni TaxID=59916 RepID=UPI001A956383|nr:uncharacterized protein LOC120770405 isoform X1 [Bactrocera tryoni]
MARLLIQHILFINFALFGYVHPTVMPTNLECDFNREVCDPSKCLLQQGRGKFKYLTAACNFIKPVKALLIDIELLRRNKLGNYESLNMRASVDVCKWEMVKGGNVAINNIMAVSLRRLSSTKCPLQGNMNVTRMPLWLFIVEGFLPDAEYKMFVRTHNDAMSVLNLNLSFSVASAKNRK